MASAGFELLCSAGAGASNFCPPPWPQGATGGRIEVCYPYHGACQSAGFLDAPQGFMCQGQDFYIGTGDPIEAVCNIQYVAPVPDAMTTADALQIGWAIVLVWALAWGVRRLLAYAADHSSIG